MIKRIEALEARITKLESLFTEKEDDDKERTDVIRKVGNKWRILGKKSKYWPAEYDTKEKAQAALKAYWANKHESLNESKSLVERYKEHK